MQVHYCDVLCMGAGLAGERVAVEAAEAGYKVICLSIVPPRRSHSSAAQGGMQAALGNSIMGDGDSPEIHFNDTVKGSDWGCDQEVARIFANTAPIAMREMAYMGVPWPLKKRKMKASSIPAPLAAPQNGAPATLPTARATRCFSLLITVCCSLAWKFMTVCRPKP